jgi:hypothetical protein
MSDDELRQLVDRIRAMDLTWAEMARIVGCSQGHLRRVINGAIGANPAYDQIRSLKGESLDKLRQLADLPEPLRQHNGTRNPSDLSEEYDHRSETTTMRPISASQPRVNWDPRRHSPTAYIQEAEKHLANNPEIVGVFCDLHMMVATENLQRWRDLAELQSSLKRCSERHRERVLTALEAVSSEARRRYNSAPTSDPVRVTQVMLESSMVALCRGSAPYHLTRPEHRMECIEHLQDCVHRRKLQLKLIDSEVLKAYPTIRPFVEDYRSVLVVGRGLAVERHHDLSVEWTAEKQYVKRSIQILNLIAAHAKRCPLPEYEKWLKSGADLNKKPALCS